MLERVGGFGGAVRKFYQQTDLYLKQEYDVLTLAALWYKTINNVLCGNQNVICVKYGSVARGKIVFAVKYVVKVNLKIML